MKRKTINGEEREGELKFKRDRKILATRKPKKISTQAKLL